MHWEVELKFAIDDLAATTAKLAGLGAHFSGPLRQTDHYFNHPARDFSRTDEALRIRQVGDENFITYKGPKVDPATKTRQELELPLQSGPAVPKLFTELLKALGFRYVASVEKRRRLAAFDWRDFQVEAALDDVQDVGNYLELEISTDDSSLEAAKSALHDLSQQFKLGKSERRSYLELLLSRLT